MCIRDRDKIIGRGYNRRMADKNTLSHAELIAIRKASRKMDDWRLEECTMYVTLEPCQMCSGAIVQSRICLLYTSQPGQAEVKKRRHVLYGPERDMADGMGGTGAG